MSDNYNATPGSGITFASDDVGPGVAYPRIKMDWGVDGVAVDVSATNPLPTAETPVAAAAADINVPSSNTAAVVTYAADTTHKHTISGVAWSYNATPTAGRLTIQDGSGNTVFDIDITNAGPGFMPFQKPKQGAAINTAMIITLAAGGAGVTGKVNVLGHWVV